MMRRLIVFTRYPVAGRAKTRLIPAVGADRAADIQRRMTERAVATVKAFADDSGNCDIEIWFFGGSEEQMQEWLGHDLRYAAQPEGDLGHKMSEALSASFNAGADSAVIIGTDCPDITAETLAAAFDCLSEKDLVLGPTHDGGYYLIGLSKYTPTLFRDIVWGTDSVLATTLERASSAGITHTQLQKLHDIDTPEDLSHLEASLSSATISVIIPALNEESNIARTIASAKAPDTCEIIVVDGGSTDSTKSIAEASGARVINSDKGRANQLNAGAKAAKGDIFLFLHADTLLPDSYAKQVLSIIAKDNTACGAFELRINSTARSFRILETLVSFRSRVLCMPYGDQALFVTRDIFLCLNGFEPMPIMEDYDFVKRAGRLGEVRISSSAVTTSARRWEKLGILRTTLINQYIIAAHRLGVNQATLAAIYTRAGIRPKKLRSQ